MNTKIKQGLLALVAIAALAFGGAALAGATSGGGGDSPSQAKESPAADNHADGETNDAGQKADDHADGETNDDAGQKADNHADGETNDAGQKADKGEGADKAGDRDGSARAEAAE